MEDILDRFNAKLLSVEMIDKHYPVRFLQKRKKNGKKRKGKYGASLIGWLDLTESFLAWIVNIIIQLVLTNDVLCFFKFN